MEDLAPGSWFGALLLWDWLRFRTGSRRLAFWCRQLACELAEVQGDALAMDKASRIIGILCEGTDGPELEVYELAPEEPRRAA